MLRVRTYLLNLRNIQVSLGIVIYEADMKKEKKRKAKKAKKASSGLLLRYVSARE